MATKAGTMTSSLGDVVVQLPAPGNNNSPVPVIDNVGAIMALHWLQEQLHNNNKSLPLLHCVVWQQRNDRGRDTYNCQSRLNE